jgi:hypothetical protein
VLVDSGEAEDWCGKVLMLFRIRVPTLSTECAFKFTSCALVRWYELLPELGDACRCPIYRWELRKGSSPPKPHVF